MSHSSPYKPISGYGLIGNCRSAALVGRDGSIDWLCFPRFDSASVFAALLDAGNGGRFAIIPLGPYTAMQQYVGNTNILETAFRTDGGVCTVRDCMPLYQGTNGEPVERHEVIRAIRCEAGEIALSLDYMPRPDYARAPVSLSAEGRSIVSRDGQQTLALHSPVPLQVWGSRASGTITLRHGEEATFVLCYAQGPTQQGEDDLPPQERLARTLTFWESKAADIPYSGPWRQSVMRSYLVLHLLTYLPTGGIVAAPTTSLPEAIGGVRNWDYRYVWLRDAALTTAALMSLGHQDEAISFFQWLGRVCARVCATPGEDFQILYRVGGEANLEEEELRHLEGYRGSRPVRIGNGAYNQVQLDIYGEVLATVHLLATAGQPITDAQWDVLRTLANLAATRWRQPGNGIWEIRGGPYHFVYPKVMCWVALEKAATLARMMGRAGPESTAWQRTAEAIKADVLHRGWSQQKQAFVQHYDTEAMDASNLLLPLVGFLPFDDRRIISTVRRIREELGHGPLLRRYRTEETDDGLPGSEGAFTVCSFWLVQVLARMGALQEARKLFGELLGYANHLGLFSEMVDPQTGEALGNFPQAFSHVGLILAAQECEIDREGG